MKMSRCLLFASLVGLAACTPLTYIENSVVQDPVPPRPLQNILLIAPAADDSVRRSYENRCDTELSDYAQTMSSHEQWPDIMDLNRENVETWLEANPSIDGIVVVQLAALEQSRGTLSQGGVATRELQLMVQPGLTWNYQPDPTLALPDHPTVLTQSSLYIRPEAKLALTMMARSDVDGKLSSLFRSHCENMIDELETFGWLE